MVIFWWIKILKTFLFFQRNPESRTRLQCEPDRESDTRLHSDLLCASTPYASSARLQPNLQETVCVGYRTHWLVLCKGKHPPRITQTQFKQVQILWTYWIHTNPAEVITFILKNNSTTNSIQRTSWDYLHRFTGHWIRVLLLTHCLFVESTTMGLH